LLALRWSVPEAMRPDDSGGTDIMLARSVAEARSAIARVNAPYNYVVADAEGNIAHFTAGRVPVRVRGDGSMPLPAEATDAWAGMIPAAEMPASINPARGWTGTANHRTVPAGFPYVYSSYFAASWRYRRMLELLDAPAARGAMDHWRFMRDTKNLLAAAIAPAMAEALAAHGHTRELGEALRGWDHHDDPDAVAPAIFQATWRAFARLTFEDELGPAVTARMLDHYYYWHERLVRLCANPADPWFDDVTTATRETRDDLFRSAGRLAREELTARLGADLEDWRWGRLHRVTFFSPVLPGGWAAALLGGGTRPKSGSGETLDRAIYPYATPYDATVIASLRFVADLGDPDKVLAVVPGGASGRQFTPHKNDQLDAWESGDASWWWFSDAEIERHARHELRLEP
jgi:penicillin amidase